MLYFSHQLPFFRSWYPTYSDNLGRLAGFIRRHFGQLRMIDVGANVGDSYLLAGAQPNDEYFLIEGNDDYFQLLKINTESTDHVRLFRKMISDRSYIAHDSVSMGRGTAKIVKGGGAECRYFALDDLILELPEMGNSNLLKSDVDGYDSKVIMGARTYISKACPALFFEHSPVDLKKAGENDVYIFEELAKLGYRRVIVYDNIGYLIGAISINATSLLRDLMFYSHQNDTYYDICCFHERDTNAEAAFLEEEKNFYTARGTKLTSPLRRNAKVLGKALSSI